MNLRPQKHAPLEVNLTPLIDVVFLLLIFFMVSTTFVHEAEIKVDLPEAGAKAEVDPDADAPLVLSIDKQGVFHFGDESFTEKADLHKALVKAAEGLPDDVTLVIRADADTRHAAVVNAMDAAAQAGLLRMSIATEIETH